MERSRYSQGFSALAVILIIVVAILVGTGGFIMMRRSTTEPVTLNPGSINAPTSSSVQEMSSTIPDIVGRGQNLECDWRMPTTGSENPFGAGKLYTTGNKGRSQIAGGTEGVAIEGNAVYKDGEVYSWISAAGTTMGFKFSKDELASMESEMTAEQRQQAEQIRQQMIFNCKPWTPDESKFTLPSGVEFK